MHAPILIALTVGLFLFRSWPQSNVILLMRAEIEGVRPNIRTAAMHDMTKAKYSMARLIRRNSLIIENYLETNPKDPLACTLRRIRSLLKTAQHIT